MCFLPPTTIACACIYVSIHTVGISNAMYMSQETVCTDMLQLQKNWWCIFDVHDKDLWYTINIILNIQQKLL